MAGTINLKAQCFTSIALAKIDKQTDDKPVSNMQGIALVFSMGCVMS